MTHPLLRFAPHTQKRALPPLIVATLALTALLQVIGRPLQTAAAPLGIVSFELAGTQALCFTCSKKHRGIELCLFTDLTETARPSTLPTAGCGHSSILLDG